MNEIRRLRKLRNLLSFEDRLKALEVDSKRLRELLGEMSDSQERQRTSLQRQIDHLSKRNNALQRRVDGVHQQVDGLRDHVESRLEHVVEQADFLKSSLEVPQELVEEFFEWKAHHPIPDEPLVTVAVATYNRAQLLAERCIPSVLGQTYGNLELIVVGDHCTDETEETVSRIEDARLRFVNLPERGSYPEDPMRRWMVAGTSAMNRALALANGDFVTHLDDDDEYAPDRLEKLVAFVSENPCDFVWHPYWWENSRGEWRLNEATSFSYSNVTTSSVFYRSWFTRIPWDINAHKLIEPGDWNRFRKIKYIGPVFGRYPDPLLKHHRQRQRS